MFKVSNLKRCFIIAEISANHGQDFKKAVAMIRAAKKCGVDAVKFQTYTADTLTIDSDKKYFQIKHPKWGGQSLYQLYQKAYTPWSWFKKLKKISEEEGLIFFSSAFDKSAVDFLNDLGVLLHKVASFEMVDTPLIEYMAKSKKPMIISTGMGKLDEIKDAVRAAKCGGSSEVTLLKCVSSYPARPDEMNLRTIPDMRKRFSVQVGLSDHTPGSAVAVASVALGCVAIEKHFTLSRRFKTADSFFSMEPAEFKIMCENVRIVEKSLGQPFYGLTHDQKKSRIFRRSIFVVQDVTKGEKFTAKNVRSIRPAHGLAPKELSKVLASCATNSIKRGTPLNFRHIK